MDPKYALWFKAGVAAFAVLGVNVLAALGRISGAEALDFTKWVSMTVIGGAALMGAAAAHKPAQGDAMTVIGGAARRPSP